MKKGFRFRLQLFQVRVEAFVFIEFMFAPLAEIMRSGDGNYSAFVKRQII